MMILVAKCLEMLLLSSLDTRPKVFTPMEAFRAVMTDALPVVFLHFVFTRLFDHIDDCFGDSCIMRCLTRAFVAAATSLMSFFHELFSILNSQFSLGFELPNFLIELSCWRGDY